MSFGSKDQPQSNTIFTRFHWLELAEYAATAGAVMGTVLALAGQHIAYVTTPLSLAIVLNLTNRQRLVRQHQQEYHLLEYHINHCYDEISAQFPSRLPAADINLSEIKEQIKDLQASLSILENKSASLATKVYQNLCGEINEIRAEISNISEPLDITNLENEIESLYAQISTFANQPRLDSQEYEKFYQNFQKLEQKHRDVILPCIKLLVKDVKELQAGHMIMSSKLENLTQEFIARPEPAQLSRIKRVVSQLNESVAQLQQTEIIADLLKSIERLQAEFNILSGKFNHRPEPQQIHKLELLVTMLVTSVTHLKRIYRNEATLNSLNWKNRVMLKKKSDNSD